MNETTQPVQDATGTLVDQSPTPEAKTPETPATTSQAEPSLINQPDSKAAAPEGAPKEYSAWKVPDGYELDEAVSKEAGKLFQGLNLPQDAAQKLVDFYTAQTLELAQAPLKQWQEMRETWRSEIKADPEIGGKLELVKATVGKALDGLGDAKLAADFKQAMDYTGAGDNPAFIRAFYKLAQKVTEGTSVKGNGPAPVERPSDKPTAAKAMYPNLA